MDWSQFEIDIECFPREILDDKEVAPEVADYLITSGLPSWCAPHLYFGSFEDRFLPLLSEWGWADDWEKGYKLAVLSNPNAYVIGSAQNHEPIVVLPREIAVYVFSETGNKLRLLNSSLGHLSRTIFAFTEMVEVAVANDTNALIENRVPYTLVDGFIRTFGDLEPGIFKANSVWQEWAREKCKNA